MCRFPDLDCKIAGSTTKSIHTDSLLSGGNQTSRTETPAIEAGKETVAPQKSETKQKFSRACAWEVCRLHSFVGLAVRIPGLELEGLCLFFWGLGPRVGGFGTGLASQLYLSRSQATIQAQGPKVPNMGVSLKLHVYTI